MRFLIIITLFLIITLSSFAKTTDQLRLHGYVPFTASLRVTHGWHNGYPDAQFQFLDNTQQDQAVKVEIQRGGNKELQKSFSDRSRGFSIIFDQHSTNRERAVIIITSI